MHIPIDIREQDGAEHVRTESANVGRGGLALHCPRALLPGTLTQLRIDCVTPRFEAAARVAWCLPIDDGYELGVEFLGPDDDLRARMVEQACYIEAYREQVRKAERRELSANEAAHEWIQKFGARFFETD
jgi:hypothetical protein